MWSKQEMALEVVNLIGNDSTVNLGIGMPTLVAELMPKEKGVMLHSENGVLGVEGRPSESTVSATLINAGKETISVYPYASYFDSALSFGMIRGGHIDYCVLGGMEVDILGNLANWMIPGAKVTGMGGAMDLVNGAKEVIIMMGHFNKKGVSKMTALCSLPLTGAKVVHTVVTDHGVFKPQGDTFKIIKLAAGITKADLKNNKLFS